MVGEKSEPFQIVVACSCKKWPKCSHLQKMAELFASFFYLDLGSGSEYGPGSNDLIESGSGTPGKNVCNLEPDPVQIECCDAVYGAVPPDALPLPVHRH
jgi:hypothetical protein